MTQTAASKWLSPRMDRLGTETAFETLAKAKALEAAGRDIVHLEIGEPDFDTPENIRDAAKKAWTTVLPTTGRPPGCRRPGLRLLATNLSGRGTRSAPTTSCSPPVASR